MNSLEYQLTIKSANQKVDDYSLTCRSSWTVARLKQHISETHVNKPNVGDQRLIYAGNLLKDNLTLKQVFFRDSLCTELTNSSKTDFTIHLVCSTSAQKSQTTNQSSPRTSASNTNSSNLAGTTQSHQTPTISSTQATPNSSAATGGIPGSSSNSTTPSTTTPSSQANSNIGQAFPLLNSTVISYAHASEIAQRLLQSDQVRQQLAIFQQLADQVAVELARNVSLNSSIAANSPGLANNVTSEQTPLLVPPSLLNGQVLNLPTGTAQTGTPAEAAAVAAAAANTHNAGNNLAAHSIASQLLYANQPNQVGAIPQNRHNLHGDNNVNRPDVGHQAQAAAAAAVAGPQQQAAAPQAPIIDQPVPAQPIDPEPGLQHDVIDWVYYSIRALIFMVALYIHASFFRLLFIVGLMALAYFFTRRSARRQNRVPAQAANMPPPRPAPAGPDHLEPAANAAPPDGVEQDGAAQDQNGELRRRRILGADGRVNDNNGEENNNQMDGAHRQHEEVAQRQVSFLKLCYLVVTDFLVSFVPE